MQKWAGKAQSNWKSIPTQLQSHDVLPARWLPDTAFRRQKGVGIATRSDFGVESSRPASLLCTLRAQEERLYIGRHVTPRDNRRGTEGGLSSLTTL
jgi:hypothetical protein